MSLPYVTPEAVSAAEFARRRLSLHPESRTKEEMTREVLEAAGPLMAKALMETFAGQFTKAAAETKLHPAIANNIRVMIEAFGTAVGPK